MEGGAVSPWRWRRPRRSQYGDGGALAGPGSNGGDAFVAARYLAAGVAAEVRCVGYPRGEHSPARHPAGRPRWPPGCRSSRSGAPGDCDLLIDGLFGAGLLGSPPDRPPPGPNTSPVLAVDVPSGLSAEDGSGEGSVLEAVRTVTFMRSRGPLVGQGPIAWGGRGSRHRPYRGRPVFGLCEDDDAPLPDQGAGTPTNGVPDRCWWWAVRRGSPGPPP